MRAADVIVKSLEAHGVSRVYCVPGESYLALLDALYGSTVEVIVCRHESGAGFMAVAEAKLTGKPAVFMVSRGPGATNGSIAVHVAEQDAVPVIALIGQVSRAERGRGAFQEVDYGHFFGSIAKGVFEVSDGAKMAETCARAFHLAAEGTAGPVVISLPEDMLSDEVGDFVAGAFPVVRPHHGANDVTRIQTLIDKSERPLVIAGSGFRGRKGAAALARFAEAQRIPVGAAWKAQDVFDNGSPLYAGHIGFGSPARHREILGEADLIIAAGTRLGDVASLNYTLPSAPEPAQTLVHIYHDGAPIGRVFRTDCGVIADAVTLFEELGTHPRVVSSGREAWISSIGGFIGEFQKFRSADPADGVDFGAVVMAVARLAPANATIVTDAGNISTWVHRHWCMTPSNVLLGAVAGSMGIGVPAAVAAGLVEPQRMAIVLVGDGGILMTGQELATALQYGAKPKIVISDNGSYGTIRTHQEKHYPHRVSGTDLVNPDFTLWARSFGALAVTIAPGDDIDAKIAEALVHDGAAVIHVKSSREALSAFTTLNALTK
ncbi:MAG: acetolactate synthase [Rhizobiales bacterium]|nr:acetolactate synthase [Hyphomicrobiales bacterium]MBI3674216.1 acetolactate synthase [Hyphomicrobiales bacterium]